MKDRPDAVARVRDDSKFLTERDLRPHRCDAGDRRRDRLHGAAGRDRLARCPAGLHLDDPRRQTEAQLLDVLGALDIRLSERHLATLDELSRPPEHFPQTFLELAKTTMLNGSNVNGVEGPIWELSPANDAERA